MKYALTYINKRITCTHILYLAMVFSLYGTVKLGYNNLKRKGGHHAL
jgi:hypothetical protein